MVAPISGPFARSNRGDPSNPKNQTIWKQAKPVTVPLPYQLQAGRLRFLSGDPSKGDLTTQLPPLVGGSAEYDRHVNAAKLQAYERLRGQVSDRAQLGAAIAEAGASCEMIYHRMKQIVAILRAIRGWNFPALMDTIGDYTIVRKGWKNNRPPKWGTSTASVWLEFSYGWAPLLGDVFSALDVLQNPFKALHPRGSGTSGPVNKQTHSGTIQSGFYDWTDETTIWRAKTGCTVTVNNPNLYLLNNLGLANPGTVVWEVIPFSFVVDWFVTVNEFLSSGTDWLGLGVTDPWNVIVRHSFWTRQVGNPFNTPPRTVWTYQTTNLDRGTALYSVPITVRPMKIPSWQRAANMTATAVALLGFFRK